jgi:hypothetical protein
MLKKTITYTDYNGVKKTEDFYFNLTNAEVAEMEMSTTGGMTDMIEKIVNAQDVPAIIKVFKELILKAYGEKTPDGKYFMKEDENGRPLANKFKQTEAYSNLFMELGSDAEKAADFFNKIIPSAPKTSSKAKTNK